MGPSSGDEVLNIREVPTLASAGMRQPCSMGNMVDLAADGRCALRQYLLPGDGLQITRSTVGASLLGFSSLRGGAFSWLVLIEMIIVRVD